MTLRTNFLRRVVGTRIGVYIQRLWADVFMMSKSEDDKGVSEIRREDGLIDGPKRKVALLLAFCGKEYYGLQCNHGCMTLPTIEGALFQALVNAKVVPEVCLEKRQQMKYTSSSRTDKGVSTRGLVVSLKLRLTDNTTQLINNHLPSDIRVLDIKRTTKSFHAKNHASSRTYSYTMPTFVFEPEVDDVHSYRIIDVFPEKLKHIKSVLFRYKGTHSFHNFTSGKRMGEDSAKRYIIDFWSEPPFVHESLEFIALKIKGQSFMIHQIRKMIGLLIALVRGDASEEHFIRAFKEPLETVPKAPGNGLILEQVHYDGYNRKYDNPHGGLEWSSSAEKAEEFMKTKILPVLYKEEIENKSMESWLETLSNHDFTGAEAKRQWEEQLQERQKKSAISKSNGLETTSQESEAARTGDPTQDTNRMQREDSEVSQTPHLDEDEPVPAKKVKLSAS